MTAENAIPTGQLEFVPTQDPVLRLIESAARDPAVDVSKLRELLAMRQDMQAQVAAREYRIAMAKAQGEMMAVATDASNNSTNSRYASHHALDLAIRPIYTANGFGLSFDTADCPIPDHIRVTCEVSHISGHAVGHHFDLPIETKGARGGDVMTKIHATMSAVTYGRRGLLGMIFNIAIARDDDGNLAGAGEVIDAMQARYLLDLIETYRADLSRILDFVRADKIETMTVAQLKKAENALREWARRNAPRRAS